MANTQNPNKQNLVLLMFLAVTWIIMFQFMGNSRKQQQMAAKPQNPEILLQKADKDLQAKKYPDAINEYQEVAGKFKDTQSGATALLRKAQAMRDAPGKLKNENGAVDTYNILISQYGDTKFPEVVKANREKDHLEVKIDKEASKDWKYKSLDSVVRFGYSMHLGRYSYFFALLIITLVVKLLTWKLSVIQYKGMRDMQRVQPIVKELQEKHKGDPKTMNAKVMEAYKVHGVNPLMGCLPLLVQLPIMWFIWSVIRKYQFQFQNGIFLWVNGSAHAALGTITLFGHKLPFIGANLAKPDIPLVALYMVSMFITQKLTVVDPTQAEQQKIMSIMMPLVFAFILWKLPSAFLLYWLMLNIVMTAHQYYVLKSHHPVPAAQVVESTVASPSKSRSRRRRKR